MNKILEQYIFDEDERKRVCHEIQNFYEENKEKLLNEQIFEKKENVVFIGLMGTIGSGKTTSQKIMNEIILQNEENFCFNFNFSDLLKEFCYKVFKDKNFYYNSFYGTQRQKSYINEKYYGLSGRKLLQVIGTDIFRELFDDNIWIKLSMNRVYEGIEKLNNNYKKIVIICGDIRFQNEANEIKKRHGYIIKIDRNFIIKNSRMNNYVSNHKSEKLDFIEYDYLIDNNSTDIEELKEKIDCVIKRMLD